MTREFFASSVAAAGRLLLAGLFMSAGASKLGAMAATEQYIAGVGLPFPALAFWGAVVVELGGGLALALGWRVRVAAAVLALFTGVAAILFHAHFDDQNQAIHFLKNFAIVGGLSQIVALGSGGFTLDALLGRAKIS